MRNRAELGLQLVADFLIEFSYGLANFLGRGQYRYHGRTECISYRNRIGNVSNGTNIAPQKSIAYRGIPYSGAFGVINLADEEPRIKKPETFVALRVTWFVLVLTCTTALHHPG